MPVTVFIGIVWTGVSSATYAVNGLSIAGIILLCTASIFVLLFQVHDSQPLFFGLEGYVDIYNLELLIFGTYERKLHWSTANSPLSRHTLDRKGMKEDFFKNTKLPLDQIEVRVRNENMYTGIDPVREGDSTNS